MSMDSIDPLFVVLAIMTGAMLAQLGMALLVWRRTAGSGTRARLGATVMAFLMPGSLVRMLLVAPLLGPLLRAGWRRIRAFLGLSGTGHAKGSTRVSPVASPDLLARIGAAESNRKLNLPKVVE